MSGNQAQRIRLIEQQLSNLSSGELNSLPELEGAIQKCLSGLKIVEEKCKELDTGIDKCFPNLSTGELEAWSKKFMSMAKCKAYFQYEWTGDVEGSLLGQFQDKKSVFPSNAASLVANGTIRVLEVVKNEDAVVGSDAEIIKMKVEGIEETVHLYHEDYTNNGKYYVDEFFTIEIGDVVLNAPESPRLSNDDEDKVLNSLHQALEIPKHETLKMICLLFYPYSADYIRKNRMLGDEPIIFSRKKLAT